MHTVNRDACTPTASQYHAMHAHVHARGAPSTNRCPGSSYRAHVREHHGFSLLIFSLFPRVCVTRIHRSRTSSSPPFASHSPSSLFSLAVSVFFLLFSPFPTLSFPPSLPSPTLVIHFIPMEGERQAEGKFDWKAGITRSSRHGRPTVDNQRERKTKGVIQGGPD